MKLLHICYHVTHDQPPRRAVINYGDGFAIRQGLWPGYVGPFVEQVIPLPQQRGVVRAEYVGTTLREHLREF